MAYGIGPSFNAGSGNPYQGYNNAPGSAPPPRNPGYNGEPPLIGPMQGGIPPAVGGFGTGSPSQDNLALMLDISPIEAHIRQTMGPMPDPSSPMAYSQMVLGPIMGGASQTFNNAMTSTSEKEK